MILRNSKSIPSAITKPLMLLSLGCSKINEDSLDPCYFNYSVLRTISKADTDDCSGIPVTENDTKESVLISASQKINNEIEIDSFKLNSKLGALFLRNGLIDSSNFYLTKAYQIDSIDKTLNYNLGLLHIKKKDFLKARFHTEVALKRCPNNVSSLSQIGRILGTLACYSESVNPLRKAIELDPSYHPSYINIIYSFYKDGQKDSVIYYLELMDNIFPEQGGKWETSSNYWKELRKLKLD